MKAAPSFGRLPLRKEREFGEESMERAALAAKGSSFVGIRKPISRTAVGNRLNPKISQVRVPAMVPDRGFCRLVDERATTLHRKTSNLSCSALAELPLGLPDCLDADNSSLCKLQALASEFESLVEPLDRVKRLLHYASFLPAMSDLDRVSSNRVMGCTAQVWVSARIDAGGRMRFAADSDSEITRGFCACLVHILDGAFPEEVLSVKTEDLGSLNVGLPGSTNSRANTWHNVLISMQKKTNAILMAREGKPLTEPFPSLVVNADGIRAKGSYAEAQVSS